MQTLALRTTTKGLPSMTFNPSFVLRKVPAAPTLLAVVLATVGLGGPPFFLQEFTRY
jgi:hypothetical protein